MGTMTGYVVRIILGGPTDPPTEDSRLLLDPAVDAKVSLFDPATGLLYVTDVRCVYPGACTWGMH
jgi:hypothetical protein